jgi:hypothetical protein
MEVSFEDILQARASGDLQRLNEVSLSRVYNHVQKAGEKSFSILTSWRSGHSQEKNRKNFDELKKKLRDQGLGFFELKGQWQECQDSNIPYDECPHHQLKTSSEPSLFVPGLKMKDAEGITSAYEQDAAVYAGPETKGKVVLIKRGGNTDVLGDFSPGCISQAYSKMKGKPFVFEYVAQSWSEAMLEQQFRKRSGLGPLIRDLKVEMKQLK